MAVVVVVVAVVVAVGTCRGGTPLGKAALVKRQGRGRLVVWQKQRHAVRAVGHRALAGPAWKRRIHLRMVKGWLS